MNLAGNAVNSTFQYLLNQNGSSITLGNGNPVNWDAGGVVVTTGNQTIGGNKTFSSPATFSSAVTFNSTSVNWDAAGAVATTGDQSITGQKTFVNTAVFKGIANFKGTANFNEDIEHYGGTVNTFGGYSFLNYFGLGGQKNHFGTDNNGELGSSNYFGNFEYNEFGSISSSNFFGTGATNNSFGSGAVNNTFGSGLFSGPIRLMIPQFSGASNQNGQLGEIRISGSGLYICTGIASGWRRIFLSSF